MRGEEDGKKWQIQSNYFVPKNYASEENESFFESDLRIIKNKIQLWDEQNKGYIN